MSDLRSLRDTDPAAFARYMAIKYPATAYNPNSAQAEAVANADAHLNNADLPNVYELARHLAELLEYSDNLRGSSVYDRCLRVVNRIRPHIAANI